MGLNEVTPQKGLRSLTGPHQVAPWGPAVTVIERAAEEAARGLMGFPEQSLQGSRLIG